MKGRDVIHGIVGCSYCHREFPILEGVVRFGEPPAPAGSTTGPVPGPGDVQALTGIMTPGGYVVLVGNASRLARDLVGLLGEVRVVAVNPADLAISAAGLSTLVSGDSIPLRTSMARAVVVGDDSASVAWMTEAARVVLPGLRVVALTESAEVPPGLEPLASGKGMWVGQKPSSHSRA